MRRTRCAIVLALALLAPACDGGASGGPPAGDGAGGGYDFSVIGRDTAGPADTGAGEFTGWTGPILCSEDLVRGPCEDAWCPAQAPCFGGAADAGCVTACIERARHEEEFLKRLLCTVAMGGDFCPAWQVCTGAWAIPLDCVQICDDLGTCGALGLQGFGTTSMDCRLSCGGAWAAGGAPQDHMECVAGALESCSGATLLACSSGQDPCAEVCAVHGEGSCTLVPGYFEATETCAGSCQAWSPGRRYATQACFSLGQAWQPDCPTLAGTCGALPPALPPGVPPYCEALAGLCATELPYLDMGLLGTDLCGWTLLGQVSSRPGLFVSWEDALTCLQGLGTCPESIYRAVYCLFLKPAEAAPLCGPLAALCSPQDYATRALQACEIHLVLTSALGVDAFLAAQACLTAAADCEAKIDCFEATMNWQ